MDIIDIPGFEQFKQRGNRFWLKRIGINNGKRFVRPDKTTFFVPEKPIEDGFKVVKQTGNAMVIELNDHS